MKTKIIYIFIGMLVIIAPNVGPLHSVLSLSLDIDSGHFRYSTYNGEFTFVERTKGENFAMMNRRFHESKKNTSLKPLKIHRLFSKNPLCFWRWASYFNDKRYDLPYLSWKEVRTRRGYDLEYATSYQDF